MGESNEVNKTRNFTNHSLPTYLAIDNACDVVHKKDVLLIYVKISGTPSTNQKLVFLSNSVKDFGTVHTNKLKAKIKM